MRHHMIIQVLTDASPRVLCACGSYDSPYGSHVASRRAWEDHVDASTELARQNATQGRTERTER